jgi:hypothetical protein
MVDLKVTVTITVNSVTGAGTVTLSLKFISARLHRSVFCRRRIMLSSSQRTASRWRSNRVDITFAC